MARLRRMGNPDIRNRIVREQAQEYLDIAIASPIPFKTGALSRSGKVEIENPGEAVFGFDVTDPITGVHYAEIQDQGGGHVPQRGYGSVKGANLYLSGTLNQEARDVERALGLRIEKELTTLTTSRAAVRSG